MRHETQNHDIKKIEAIETLQQQITNLAKLRSLQELALEKNYPARITEFVLLPFVMKTGEYLILDNLGQIITYGNN